MPYQSDSSALLLPGAPSVRTRSALRLCGCLLALCPSLAARAQVYSLVQWGDTSSSQAQNAPSTTERFFAVDAGSYHTLALRPDGSLVQWGRTTEGQLTGAPGTTERFMSIAAGGAHSLALRHDGSLVQWGANTSGQLNNSPVSSERFATIVAGYHHNLALRHDGSLVQWGRTLNGQATNAPDPAERFVAIAAGFSHNLALRADGTLVQWGATNFGQATNAPDASERFTAIAAGFNHSLALRHDGSLVQWGRTEEGQLTNAPAASEKFIAVTAGSYHNLALRENGSLVQWGSTGIGQLNNSPATNERFAAISGGEFHSAALRGTPSLSALNFTYQGVLRGVEGDAADLRFSLWNAPTGGGRFGPVLTRAATPLDAAGVFTVRLDFGLIDPSVAPWLQIEVRVSVSGEYTTLDRRQYLSPAPMATVAGRALGADAAQTASVASSVPWSGVTGVPPLVASGGQWVNVTGGINYGGGRVGIGTTTPGHTFCVDPNGPGGMTIGGPSLTTGNRTVMFLGVSGAVDGYGQIETVRQSGFAPGNLAINVTSGPMFGFVGIGTANPSAKLTVAGEANKPGGGSWGTFSDARLKRDIAPLTGSLDALLSIRGVSFEYKDAAGLGERSGRRVGMIAQEVERVFPDWVSESPDGHRILTFSGFEALTVEALRELRDENHALRSEVERLQREHREMRRIVERLGRSAAGREE